MEKIGVSRGEKMAQYIKAHTTAGTTVICEFQKNQGLRRFAADVMGGRKALPVWRLVGTTHPHSGEQVLLRTRAFINGSTVTGMEEVEPTREDHGYDPANFQSVVSVRGLNGTSARWIAPASQDDAIDGAVAGVAYPIHRDVADSRRFVILRAAEGVTAELRHYLDPERGAGYSEDMDDDGDIDFDDDDI
jgi:hypothetical protein